MHNVVDNLLFYWIYLSHQDGVDDTSDKIWKQTCEGTLVNVFVSLSVCLSGV